MKRVIIISAILACFSIVCSCAAAPLLNEEQAISVARAWLAKPDWVPTERKVDTFVYINGKTIYHMFLGNDTDSIHIDRSNGRVFKWVTGAYDPEDASADDSATLKAFKAWAPTHVSPALMAKLTMVWPSCWMHRQANGILHPDTYVYVESNRSGSIVYAEMHDGEHADYNGPINITPKKAMILADKWVRTEHYTNQGHYTWLYNDYKLKYGLFDKTLTYPVPVYTIVCDLPASLQRCGCESHFNININAVTGEVWDEDDCGRNLSVVSTAKSQMLVVDYNNKYNRGYLDGLIPLKRLIAFSNKKISAKAGDLVFYVNGKRAALPTKVVSKHGNLYLPWQALKTIKGVTTTYYPMINYLKVTTIGTKLN